MSIIVRELLRNYNKIDDTSRIDLDVAISSLYLNSKELTLVRLVKEEYTPMEMVAVLKVDHSTVRRRLNRLCDRISNHLGDPYEDSVILESVKIRLGRELTDDETMFCWSKIRSLGVKGSRYINIRNFSKVVFDD